MSNNVDSDNKADQTPKTNMIDKTHATNLDMSDSLPALTHPLGKVGKLIPGLAQLIPLFVNQKTKDPH